MSSLELNNATIKPQTLVINDQQQLHRCFMPFIKNGGLFLPFNQDVTPEKIFPGQKIFVILTLAMLNNTKAPISGNVIWINPSANLKGYGIQFQDNQANKHLLENIHKVLENYKNSNEPTYTL